MLQLSTIGPSVRVQRIRQTILPFPVWKFTRTPCDCRKRLKEILVDGYLHVDDDFASLADFKDDHWHPADWLGSGRWRCVIDWIKETVETKRTQSPCRQRVQRYTHVTLVRQVSQVGARLTRGDKNDSDSLRLNGEERKLGLVRFFV